MVRTPRSLVVAARAVAYARDAAVAARAAADAAYAAEVEASRATRAADAYWNNERAALVAVAALRSSTRKVVETPTPRSLAEHVAFAVNAVDGADVVAESLASSVDGAGGIARADRVDERFWFADVDAAGNDVWRTVPDAVALPATPAPAGYAWRPRTVVRR